MIGWLVVLPNKGYPNGQSDLLVESALRMNLFLIDSFTSLREIGFAGPEGFEPSILGCLRKPRFDLELSPKAHVLVLARLRARKRAENKNS